MGKTNTILSVPFNFERLGKLLRSDFNVTEFLLIFILLIAAGLEIITTGTYRIPFSFDLPKYIHYRKNIEEIKIF
jgi:hypothetical protein